MQIEKNLIRKDNLFRRSVYHGLNMTYLLRVHVNIAQFVYSSASS
jgi:hypothetical protein